MTLTVGNIAKTVQQNKARPNHGAEYAKKLVARYDKLPKEHQQDAAKALSQFSKESLEKLRKSGNRILIRRGEEGLLHGRYDSKEKIIHVFAAPVQDSGADETITHETVHALANAKWEDENGVLTQLVTPDRDKDFSRHDPKLRKLHKEYIQRTLVGVGHQIADSVDLKSGATKGKKWMAGRNLKWKKTEDGIEFRESGGMLGRIAEFAGTDLKKGVLYGALGVAAVAAIGGVVGPAAVGVAAVMGLGGGALIANGVKHLASAARSIRNEFAVSGHKSDQVEISGTRIKVKLDGDLKPEQKPTSTYATIQRQPEEYLAESMVDFLAGGDTREQLKERDPKMHDYCMDWNIHA